MDRLLEEREDGAEENGVEFQTFSQLRDVEPPLRTWRLVIVRLEGWIDFWERGRMERRKMEFARKRNESEERRNEKKRIREEEMKSPNSASCFFYLALYWQQYNKEKKKKKKKKKEKKIKSC